MSIEDAEERLTTLDRIQVILIGPMLTLHGLSSARSRGPAVDTTEQEIQAAPRRAADGHLEQEGLPGATTGNKSEMAVGYLTLYGDMAGGLTLGRRRRWCRTGAIPPTSRR
jgi:NH3-dependent NAD+ synthetase